MPLFMNKCEVRAEDLESYGTFIQKYEKDFIKRNEYLKAKPVKPIGSISSCLYVHQREIASTGPLDDVVYSIGTDMMTTCHCVVLRDPISKAAGLGHFDGNGTLEGINEMERSVKEIAQRDPKLARSFELHMVGGFEDQHDTSKNLSLDLLKIFHSLASEFHLETFCCTTLNQHKKVLTNVIIKSPWIRGLEVDIKTGELFPAVFNDYGKGPATALRGARCLHEPHLVANLQMTNIYKWAEKQIILKPFSYTSFPDVGFWLGQSDGIIRNFMSTSPAVEASNFVSLLKGSLGFMRENPNLEETVFQNGCLIFEKNQGNWSRFIDLCT